ncbi:hypothetical protein F53441_1046 [Fusarium austroafricanum]|uniref:Uncharacterized protein n=1 Tax=Fusarium austroafricanum TaxID=2364996 RepID=A0A8H4KTD1_9HYPO|nr:hypothetical protein F53441_1046 [Fusarium austroafricanum]
MSEPPSSSAHLLMKGDHNNNQQDVQPWTAARCQRLLRQLQCRLVVLRKLVHEAQQPTATARAKRTNVEKESTEATKPSKRARYTYGGRRMPTAQTKPTTPRISTPPRAFRTLGSMKIDRSPGAGRIDFITSVTQEFTPHDLASETSRTSLKPNTTDARLLLAELQSLRRIVSDSQYRIYEAIFGWLNGLLSSTESLSQTAHPKSLLGMCLRRVPDAISVIEEWDRQTAAKEGKTFKWQSSKVSAELYEQLEGFGTTSLGWKSLKLVVRAHGLCLLATAVSEGLFEPLFVRLLAGLCFSLDCKAEAARLVSSLRLPLAAPRGTSSSLLESTAVQPLEVIVKSLQGRGIIGPSWSCLSNLIDTKTLSLAWLTSRRFQSVWMRGIEILLHSRTLVPSVINFMCTALNLLLLDNGKTKETQQPAEDQTLVSILAAITAAVWTLGAEMDDKEPWKICAIRRLLFTLELCVTQQQTRRGAFRSNGFLTLVLARFLATSVIDNKVGSLSARNLAIYECVKLFTVRNGSPTQTQYRQALLLVCSVAQYRGRACGLACHDILSEIRTLCNELGLPDWFQDGLMSDGAFVLAQKTKDLRDVAFAERFPTSGKGTLETSTMFSGWRWEEGIGEWVLSSPGHERRSELRQQGQNQDGTSYQTGTDHQPDSRGRTTSLRGNTARNLRRRIKEDSSVGSSKDAGVHDDTDGTDRDENDTSATSIADIDEVQDSGDDELGDCVRMLDYNPTRTLGRRHGDGNGNGSDSSRNTTIVKPMKKVKRLDITRTWQENRPDRVIVGTSEDNMDDELSML